jgi:hypothetical protein
VTAESARWNRFIAPEKSVSFGFVGSQSDGSHEPSYLFYLNGKACSIP